MIVAHAVLYFYLFIFEQIRTLKFSAVFQHQSSILLSFFYVNPAPLPFFKVLHFRMLHHKKVYQIKHQVLM